jgi:hypothetical protein
MYMLNCVSSVPTGILSVVKGNLPMNGNDLFSYEFYKMDCYHSIVMVRMHVKLEALLLKLKSFYNYFEISQLLLEQIQLKNANEL